jgi:hypothetical protein
MIAAQNLKSHTQTLETNTLTSHPYNNQSLKMASKPVLILVPGSFSNPEFYSTVIDAIAAKGYEIHGVNLGLHIPIPSTYCSTNSPVTVGKKPGNLPSVADDAAHINQTVTEFADKGKDVVLIAHSYGGTPMSESIKGIGKAEREKAGKKGGVVRVAYMTALVPAVGVSAGALMAVANTPAPEGLMLCDAVSALSPFPRTYLCLSGVLIEEESPD